MSVSAAQAAAFYEEIVGHGQVWAVRDAGGFPAPRNGDGQRSMPFWSLRSRAEKVIASVPAYQGFEPVALALDEWGTVWLDNLERDGLHVGLNWSGARATGFDFSPADVRTRLEVAQSTR
jgi:hypothetical protein